MEGINVKAEAIAVIFQEHSTIITRKLDHSYVPSITVTIIPSANGMDIDHIMIRSIDHDHSFSEIIDTSDIFTITNYCIMGDQPHLVTNIFNYMKHISKDDASIIVREYEKSIEDGLVLDGFIAGLGGYLAFLILNENDQFRSTLPFQIGIPYLTRRGNVLNKNMFRFVSLPLMAYSRLCRGVKLQLMMFVQTFINMWTSAFCDGPIIKPEDEANIHMGVIMGMSDYTIRQLGDAQSHYQSIVAVELKLKAYIDESIGRMQREIKNALIETRESINNLIVKSQFDLESMDQKIDEKINLMIGTLSEKIIIPSIPAPIPTPTPTITPIPAHIVNAIREEAVDTSLLQKISSLETQIEILSHKLEQLEIPRHRFQRQTVVIGNP